MMSLKQNKIWLQAATVSFGLMAACALHAAEDAKPDAMGSSMESMGQMSEMENDGKGIEGGKHMCKGHMQGMMEDGHESIADDLKLDDKQKTLFKAAMKQMREGMHGGMALHQQLKAEVESDKYDEKRVREIVRKHNAEMEEQMVAASKAMHDFYQSLGPWQKEKFKAIKDDMHSKMRDRIKDRMKEHMGDHMKEHMGHEDAPAAGGAEHEHNHDHGMPTT